LKTISLKDQILFWAQRYTYVAYLDSCNYPFDQYSMYDCLVAVSNKAALSLNKKDLLRQNAFSLLKKTVTKNPGWWFGGFSYDLKNQIEELQSDNYDGLIMPELFFFQPELLFKQQKGKWTIEIFNKRLKFESIIKKIKQTGNTYKNEETIFNQKINIKTRTDKNTYFKAFNKIKQDIIEGTYYELNFCREFYAEKTDCTAHERHLQKR